MSDIKINIQDTRKIHLIDSDFFATMKNGDLLKIDEEELQNNEHLKSACGVLKLNIDHLNSKNLLDDTVASRRDGIEFNDENSRYWEYLGLDDKTVTAKYVDIVLTGKVKMVGDVYEWPFYHKIYDIKAHLDTELIVREIQHKNLLSRMDVD